MTTINQMRDRLKSILTGSSATKHVLAVSSGVILAQSIGLIASPINSRLYSPLDYGTLAIFASLYSLATILATMRYDMVLPIAEDDAEGLHVLMVCLLCIVGWTLVACLLVFLAGDFATLWLAKGNPQFRKYIWFFPLGLFTTSIFTVLSAWAVRKRAFVELSIARVMQSALGQGCMVLMGFFRTGALGLLSGNILFTSSGVRKLFVIALRDLREQFSKLSLRETLRVARKYYRYPLFITGAAFINGFSTQVPTLFLAKGFGSDYTGYFMQCNKILTIPAAVIGSAVAPVFFSRMKQAQQEGNLKEKTIRLLDSIVGINAFFMVFLALFGELFFTFVLGAQWRRSGQYAAALAPWILCSFLVTPLENLPLLFERQATLFAFQTCLLFIRIGAMLIGISLHNDLVAMILFGGISALYMLVFLGWLLRLVKVPLSRPFLQLGKELLLAGGLLGACRLVMWWSHGNLYITGLVLVPVLAFGAVRGLRQLMHGRFSAESA